MNGHLDGARMADDSSRGRVVARPSSIQTRTLGLRAAAASTGTDRRRRKAGKTAC